MMLDAFGLQDALDAFSQADLGVTGHAHYCKCLLMSQCSGPFLLILQNTLSWLIQQNQQESWIWMLSTKLFKILRSWSSLDRFDVFRRRQRNGECCGHSVPQELTKESCMGNQLAARVLRQPHQKGHRGYGIIMHSMTEWWICSGLEMVGGFLSPLNGIHGRSSSSEWTLTLLALFLSMNGLQLWCDSEWLPGILLSSVPQTSAHLHHPLFCWGENASGYLGVNSKVVGIETS